MFVHCSVSEPQKSELGQKVSWQAFISGREMEVHVLEQGDGVRMQRTILQHVA